MKANFALTLSFTGIRLLHRAAGGWRFVGDVATDDPDIDGALAALRRTALELEPYGLRTKLVLPGTQIRYLTIDTSETPESEIRAAAEAALDGATPYAVSELVFDVSPDGDRTHVAAVARETLQEAEAFAIKHRFAPISLVARPDGEDFLGEPFFGPTDFARHMLGAEETVEADGVAVVELGPAEVPDGPVVDVADETPVAQQEPPEAADKMPASVEEADAPVMGEPSGQEKLAMQAEPGPVAQAPRPVGFASRRRSDAETAPKLGGVTRRFDPVAATEATTEDAATAEAPSASVRKSAPPTPDAPQNKPAKATPEPPVDDDIPNPPAAVIAAFLSRRKSKAPVHDPRDGKPGATPEKPSPAEPAEKPPAPAAAERTADLEQAEEAVGLPAAAFAADQTPPEIRPLRVPRPRSERERMTVFGARTPEGGSGAVVGGKPRYLGLTLTAVLLVFLIGVAAWAAVFMEDGIARFFAPRNPETPVTAEEKAPEPDAAALSSAQDTAAGSPDTSGPNAEAPETRTAALDPDITPADSEASASLATPEASRPFDPTDSVAQYEETGIWTGPPDVPQAPPLVDVDDLYVTSIDPPSDAVDAVALQPETAFRSDVAPLPMANPAPPGTEFELNDRGLVIPTPDGAMTPDGIMVYSGAPPVVPPEIPQRAEEETSAEDAALRQDLLRFRPRVRPTDLVENNEREQLGGLSRSELAAYRPEGRPDAEKQAEEEDETPTEQAVASSLRPSDRPGNFARIVARAQERNVNPAAEAAENAPQQVAAVAPRAVAPSIPSRSSVTKEATVRNAINLRRINLMGVYGTPSNRRALVRLSNGRYKKVKVGDRIDGGRVSAIGDSELSYIKDSRNIVLRMPRT